MTTITCPCCDGTGGSTVDDLGSMEPAYVTGCHVCHGTHYIDTVAFTKAMLLETTDIYEAAGKAATDIPSSVEDLTAYAEELAEDDRETELVTPDRGNGWVRIPKGDAQESQDRRVG